MSANQGTESGVLEKAYDSHLSPKMVLDLTRLDSIRGVFENHSRES